MLGPLNKLFLKTIMVLQNVQGIGRCRQERLNKNTYTP
jgi:hypothetical protein